MFTKTKMTVTEARNNSHIARTYNDVFLAAAMQIKDEVSQRVIRAHSDLAAVDHDNDNAFAVCVDAVNAAEKAFINRHKNTVVSL